MKKFWPLALITLLICSLIACKKNSSDIDPYEGLTGYNVKLWGLFARSTVVNGSIYNSAVDLNEKNNRYSFYAANNTFIVYSINNFYPADTGKWSISSDRQALYINGSKTHDNTFYIESITDTYMRLREDRPTLSIKTEYTIK